MLNKINELLKELDVNVYYGMSTQDEEEDWNYIIFNRKKIKPSGQNKTGYTYYYSVTIVREAYIDENFEQKVINKLTNNTSLRLADNEYMYNYLIKPNTNTVVELLTLDFISARKRDETI